MLSGTDLSQGRETGSERRDLPRVPGQVGADGGLEGSRVSGSQISVLCQDASGLGAVRSGGAGESSCKRPFSLGIFQGSRPSG